MKVEVDENYCCDQVMSSKEVYDVETKKSSVILVCRVCNAAIELESESCLHQECQ